MIRQYVLDLACSYLGAGLLEDALQILEQAWLEWPYAMVAYLAAYIQGRLGRDSEKATWLHKGSLASPDYVFPGRLDRSRLWSMPFPRPRRMQTPGTIWEISTMRTSDMTRASSSGSRLCRGWMTSMCSTATWAWLLAA